MQSFQQYREIGRRVYRQYEGKKAISWHRRRGDTGALTSDYRLYDDLSPTLAPSLDLDPEKVEDSAPQRIQGPSTRSDERDRKEGVNDSDFQDIEKSETRMGRVLTGIEVRKRTTLEGSKGENVFIVDYQGEDDPTNPHRWSYARRIWAVSVQRFQFLRGGRLLTHVVAPT